MDSETGDTFQQVDDLTGLDVLDKCEFFFVNDTLLPMNLTITSEISYSAQPVSANVRGTKKVKLQQMCPDCFPNQCHCGTSSSIEFGSDDLDSPDSTDCSDIEKSNNNVTESHNFEPTEEDDEDGGPQDDAELEGSQSSRSIKRSSKRKRSASLETYPSLSPPEQKENANSDGLQVDDDDVLQYQTPPVLANHIKFTPPLSSTPKVSRTTKIRPVAEDSATTLTTLVQKLNFVQ